MKSKNLLVAAIFAAAVCFLGAATKAVLNNDATVALVFAVLSIIATLGAHILEMRYESDEDYALEWYSTPARVLAILGALGMVLSCTSCSSDGMDAIAPEQNSVEVSTDTLFFYTGDEYRFFHYEDADGRMLAYRILMAEDADTLAIDENTFDALMDCDENGNRHLIVGILDEDKDSLITLDIRAEVKMITHLGDGTYTIEPAMADNAVRKVVKGELNASKFHRLEESISN